jgi:hypothetical protein
VYLRCPPPFIVAAGEVGGGGAVWSGKEETVLGGKFDWMAGEEAERLLLN